MPAGDAPLTFVILYERVAVGAKKFMVGTKPPGSGHCQGVTRIPFGSKMGLEVSRVALTTDPLVYTKLRPSRARPKLVARPGG